MNTVPDPESIRLTEAASREKNWKRWGPYLSERQWGTVREDYSADGDAWSYFPHEAARSRAYRWGEDGLLGICDRECRLCFALALWNERDPILKERLFGLTNPQGNHGEDVKEAWYYLDATPAYSYARGLYKYPQAEFPYERLVQENARRGKTDREFEIHDTGIFDENRYWDVFVEYAKAAPDDIYIRITIENRFTEEAALHLLPTLWFRNSWSWGGPHSKITTKPGLRLIDERTVAAQHETLGEIRFQIEQPAPILFTENDTNTERLFGAANAEPFVKDAFHDYVIGGVSGSVHPTTGTKCAPHYHLTIPGNGSATLRFRLHNGVEGETELNPAAMDSLFEKRKREAETFYAAKYRPHLNDDQKRIIRQAYAGLLWSKQYYGYVVSDWLAGDPNQPPPPAGHANSRNADWTHLYASDVLSMPDKWEYPWFAAWDLSFHMIPMARVDPDFAKSQLELLLREWYLHPNGQMPAYEWNFSDVNPPVHAWACWRVYKISAPAGERDTLFLERCFQKLLLNFTWWVNRKDVQGRHVFSGGFLGLDNIGIFDRSKPLPDGKQLEQADGTAWMAFYCATMLSIALELAQSRPAYEDIASKFFEHFVQIVDAMNALGGCGLWNEEDGFYYDQVLAPDGSVEPLRIRSLVGIIPLLAVEVLDNDAIHKLPGFEKRLDWFLKYRPDLAEHVSCVRKVAGDGGRRLLAIPSEERLRRVLRHVLDESQFLSPWGIRSLSRAYAADPYVFCFDDACYTLRYEPGESQTSLFGGNSNWRGPVWFPINYLLIEALERYHHFYGSDFLVEFPTGSGTQMNLADVARMLAGRLAAIFAPNEKGARPCFGDNFRYATDPHWRDYLLFHEYFHGDIGCGLGASHQTGWTALVTRCLGIVGKVAEDE